LLRCLDRQEAESLLTDPFSQIELLNHLETLYGPVSEHFTINYKTSDILNKFIKQWKHVGTDEIAEFEKTLQRTREEILGIEDETASAAEKIEEASFEDLLHLAKDEIMM